MIPALPEDLIEPIVRSIGRDTKALKACTLASRSWYLSGRKLLHARLSYWWGRKHLDFYKKNPHLLNCVKTFVFCSEKHCLAWEYTDLRDVRFSNVTTLHIINAQFMEAPRLCTYFKQQFPAVKSLSLQQVKFSSNDRSTSFDSFIRSFPLLTMLTMHNVLEIPSEGGTPDWPIDTQIADALTRLRHVELDTTCRSTMLTNVIKAHDPGTVPVTFINVDMRIDEYWLPISWATVVQHLDHLACVFGTTLTVLRMTQGHMVRICEMDEHIPCLKELRVLQRVELVLESRSPPHWANTLLIAADLRNLKAIDITFAYPTLFLKKNEGEGNIHYTMACFLLDEFFVTKHKHLGEAFPQVSVTIPPPYRRLCNYTTFYDGVRTLLPRSVVGGFLRIMYPSHR